ncbi:GvpL/GvpF family gas vesicle protein [Streptomyces sp. NPDC046805]|uniref:GvpL/GvpF family gas vesicle protein n=1 Tax=Streptomyces sp. NPDC046805 TaxID=3155134 RepID=UPI0033CD6601
MTRPVPAAPPAMAATYVFAICRHVDEGVLSRLPGITTAPVRTLPFERLHAVVQAVPAAEADRRSWTERLSDPGELERCVRAHHQVVTAVAAHGPAVPMALATLYRCEERARQALGADAARFHAALDRVGGRVEWGVKVYVSSASAATEADRTTVAPARVPAGPPVSGAGRAYLERVRGTHRAREQSRRAALQAAEETDRALRGLSVAARRLRLQDPQLSDCRQAQVLNGAYLVDEDQTARFTEAVATLGQRTGALIELSGPWVPYSFAGEDGAHGDR